MAKEHAQGRRFQPHCAVRVCAQPWMWRAHGHNLRGSQPFRTTSRAFSVFSGLVGRLVPATLPPAPKFVAEGHHIKCPRVTETSSKVRPKTAHLRVFLGPIWAQLWSRTVFRATMSSKQRREPFYTNLPLWGHAPFIFHSCFSLPLECKNEAQF